MNKNSEASASLTPVPEHVPENLVYAYDYINDPAILIDPHKRMAELARTTAEVFWSPLYGGHWVVRSKKGIEGFTANPELFSSSSDMIPPMGHKQILIPLSLDPPEHTGYRMPLNRDFSPAGVKQWADMFNIMANDLIDKVADKNGCDFLVDIAEPLPVILFMKIAGMPTDRLAEFRKLAEDATAAPDGNDRKRAFEDIAIILAGVIESRQKKPQDDLISKLISLDFDGRKLTFSELQSYAVLLFLGGLETVVNQLSFSVRYLAMNPALQTDLRAHPEKMSYAVEELLRLHGIASTIREVTRDVSFFGIDFKQGERLLLHIPAANYDPYDFPDPEKFIINRKEHHITFNSGPHRCLGANLARLELRTFLKLWLDRIPSFHIDTQKTSVYFGGLNLAVRHLPLVW